MEEISKEESAVKKMKLPKYYNMGDFKEREMMLQENYLAVNRDVKDMIDEILKFAKK